MSKFNSYLEKIGSDINIRKEDREPFTKDYDEILNYIVTNMKNLDDNFRWMFSGTSLFGY